MTDDGLKRKILARRASFLAAVVTTASAASGCDSCAPEPCLSAKPLIEPDASPTAPEAEEDAGRRPMPCLSIRPPLEIDDAGGDARPARPHACLSPVIKP